MDASNSYPLQPLQSPISLSQPSTPLNASTLGEHDPHVNSTESASSRTKVGDSEGTWKPSFPSDSFDYERKYPPDKEFKEMAPTARVWMTYNDEATKIVVEAVEDWREGLDMLLVFAAIFSAVVTTFVVQTCQNLQVNYSEVTATLVLELIKLQYAIATADKLSPPSVLDVGTSSFRPQRNDLWVNGLWFSSLGLSLSTALITVLVKQWIHQYMSVPSGTPRDQARTRQFRNDSFQKWHVSAWSGHIPSQAQWYHGSHAWLYRRPCVPCVFLDQSTPSLFPRLPV
ncbi:hypothetical protein BDZ89DRAFT_1078940 [Hymenopellis radicata]|nr:hypothetical protein BDZ89DRAFT_1078940 [Hymenopellis radicata]